MWEAIRRSSRAQCTSAALRSCVNGPYTVPGVGVVSHAIEHEAFVLADSDSKLPRVESLARKTKAMQAPESTNAAAKHTEKATAETRKIPLASFMASSGEQSFR